MSVFSSIRNLLAFGDSLDKRGFNLEDPNTPLGEALGAAAGSPSGISVGPKSAMGISAVLSCVRIISEGVGTIPIHAYRRVADGGKERDREHPVYALLHSAPNPYMTPIVWKELAVKQVLLRGNHYSEIQFDRWGYPVALWPLNPDSTWPEIGADGVLRYRTVARGQGRILPADLVLHIKGLTEDGLEGVSLISYGRDTLGVAKAADNFSSSFFSKGANPSGVLTSEKPLGKEGRARLAEAWRQAYTGLDNAFRVVVLEDGVTWTQTTIKPSDAQMIEAKKYSRSEIAGIFRVPPHLMADSEKSTSWGTGIEEMNIGFVKFTLMPWLVRIEQEVNRKLYTQAEQPTRYAEFLVEGFLRGSMKSRAEALHIMRNDGIISADEWRSLENMNPLPDGVGSVILANGNMTPVQTLSAPAPAPDTEPPAAARALAVITRDAFERIAARAAKDWDKAARKEGADPAAVAAASLDSAWLASVLALPARCAGVADPAAAAAAFAPETVAAIAEAIRSGAGSASAAEALSAAYIDRITQEDQHE